MIEISVDIKNYERKLGKIGADMTDAISRGLSNAAKLLIGEARVDLNESFHISKSSTVPRSIQVDAGKTTKDSITVGINTSTSPHAIFLHEGTKDHDIPLTHAKALHWVSGGADCFSRGHRVSGIEKIPFLHNAAERERSSIALSIKRQLKKAIDKAIGSTI